MFLCFSAPARAPAHPPDAFPGRFEPPVCFGPLGSCVVPVFAPREASGECVAIVDRRARSRTTTTRPGLVEPTVSNNITVQPGLLQERKLLLQKQQRSSKKKKMASSPHHHPPWSRRTNRVRP